MFADAYLAAEQAARLQREWADEASRSCLARIAGHVEQCGVVPQSLVGRLTSALRPAPEPCTTS